ncbi:MAG: reverse transcriptase-like protein [Sphaerobacter sp.]|nr:reverse transcriptase-like protein [Sphaerobacter sp.]
MTARECEPDLTIVCDGGSLGNPGRGYGSYRLTDKSGASKLVRLEFGDGVTNNQAEYRTLIAALEAALAHAAAHRQRPEDLCLRIRTDSQLLVEQLTGRWKVRHPDLKPLHARATALVARFGRRDIAWQPRNQTVRVLGH